MKRLNKTSIVPAVILATAFTLGLAMLIVMLYVVWLGDTTTSAKSQSAAVIAASEQTSESVLYVPLIGITSVPEPSVLPNGAGNVTYKYAVKNFLIEGALTNIEVVDDKCSPVKFVEGDDNGDGKLDYSETWRYACTKILSETTESIATVTGINNNLIATQKAYATVVVGSENPAPLVSIINITKVAYPLTLPPEGGEIIFIYRVNNPGVVPLSNVVVTDDKCSDMSNKLGDINHNDLLDVNEGWIYTCTTRLNKTTTSTVNVVAYANSLKAVGYAALTVKVATRSAEPLPNLPDTGEIAVNPNLKIIVWGFLLGVLLVSLIIFSVLRRKKQ